MKPIRNVAITGVDRQEKYDMVCDLVGDERGRFCSGEIGLVMYDDGHSDYFMGFWGGQNFSHCTLYTYEEFIAKYGEKKCDGKWNGYHIEASQEAYDLLLADGHSGLPFYTEEDREKGYFNIHKGWFYLDPYADGILHTTFKGFLTTYLVRSLKPLYIVNGKLSATQYHPDEVAFKNKPEDFTITEAEASNQYFVFVKGGPTPTVKHDTFEEAIKERDRLSKLPSMLNREIYVCEIVEEHIVVPSLVKIEKEK